MSSRIANIIVLGEDQEHHNLVRRYLIRCGYEYRRFRFVPLPAGSRCGSQYVCEQFPLQVGKCRETLGKRASCLLIVITDADHLSTSEREAILHQSLDPLEAVTPHEPIVILIPKWHVETWIKCLLGQQVQEEDRDTDRPPVSADDIRAAAETLYAWTRSSATIGSTCVDSLKSALPRWRRIG